MSKFLRRTLKIFIIKGFWTIVFIFIVFSTTFRPICPLAFFRCLSKFRECFRVRQTPEEGRRTYRPKCWGNNNKDEDNSPKTLNDKNHQASSKKYIDKHLKKAGGHIGWNVVEITIKMKIIVWKSLTIKISPPSFTWIVFVMGGRWSYSCCFVGCYLLDLFNIARSILV